MTTKHTDSSALMCNYRLPLAFFSLFMLAAQSASGLNLRAIHEPDAKVEVISDAARACSITGDVETGDFEKVKNFIGNRTAGYKQLACDIVYLNSNGGNFSEAIKIMDYFFSSMIATSVEAGSTCYSACAIMWLGGSVPNGHNLDNPHAYRRLHPKGILGFHAPYIYLSDGSYTNYDVMVNGTLSFKIAQELLIRFQDHRIPLWFAAKLLHPDPAKFYLIETIEDANLIGAEIPIESFDLDLENTYSLGNICFNLSHWGKNRSAIYETEKMYSNNKSTFSNVDEYIKNLNEATINYIPGKYISGLSNFLSTTNSPAQMKPSDVDLLSETTSQDPGSLLVLWQQLSKRLGTQFQPVAPGFLRWQSNEWTTNYTYLFPSPGVVGAHDENVRDRPEWCAISLPTRTEKYQPTVFYAIGTEFAPVQELVRLPAALLALPANTKLVELENKLTSNLRAPVRAHLKPSWCAQAITVTERTICNSEELSRMDIDFEREFTSKRASAKERSLSVAREMNRLRNKCAASVDCIKGAYETGISRLDAI